MTEIIEEFYLNQYLVVYLLLKIVGSLYLNSLNAKFAII